MLYNACYMAVEILLTSFSPLWHNTQYQQQTLKIMEAHKTHNGSVNFLAQVCVFNR